MGGLIIRAKGADWRGRGLRNINRFVDMAAMTYGFDFADRSGKFSDLTGQHTVTPHRNLGNNTSVVADPAVAVTADDGQGVRVESGVLISSVALTPINNAGAPMTFMVVGRDSGATTQGTFANLLAYGFSGGDRGIGLSRHTNASQFLQMEAPSSNLSPGAATSKTQATVLFLTYDGTAWRSYDYSNNHSSALMTNAALGINDPMLQAANAIQGKILLGGNPATGSVSFGNFPVIYQQAKWSRLLTADEMAEQYVRCKQFRPTLGL